MKKSTTIWREYPLDSQKNYSWKLGPLSLWAHHKEGEWKIAYTNTYDNEETEANFQIGSENPDDVEWDRFIHSSSPLFTLKPTLPDKPVVIKPNQNISILPGQSGSFIFTIPLFVQALAGKKKDLLIELPIVDLSETWFGDMYSGFLSYALGSSLLTQDCDYHPVMTEAVCPVQIKNTTGNTLTFQRSCIQVEYLSLFSAEDALVTNQVSIQFKGQDQESQINFSKKPPHEYKAPKLISGPRIPIEQSILRKSFTVIKYFTGF
ncbi:MAG: hypothetical protein ACLFR1_02100 [Spirochaetia bacterium]